MLAGVIVILLLQAVLLWRAQHSSEDDLRWRTLQDSQEKGLARLERELREELSRGRREDTEESFRDREERAQSANLLAQALSTQVGQFGASQAERLEAFARELNRFSLGLDERFERLKIAVEGRLTAMQADNAAKLEEMRRTVDEKLHATLEQRLGQSFKLVSDRLEQVHRGLGEMQTLAAGVGDLKRVLTNVKTRGTWGEVQLAALLEQLLTAEQFSANVITRPGSNERVDFAIRLPGKGDGAVVWLPIDAKFPIEDYQRLLDAQDRCEPALVEEAARAIESRLKGEAKSIHEKYVSPPHTTDFAMLYLPIEGLYAEALRRPGLAEALQRDYRVSLAGPTTLAALLNSLQMGFQNTGYRATFGRGLGRARCSENRVWQVWRSAGTYQEEA
jgi:DNA recombination protein RmuC